MSPVRVDECHADLSSGSLINYVLSVFEITPLFRRVDRVTDCS